MQTILILPANIRSHIEATVGLAKTLAEEDYNVVYGCSESSFTLLKAYGFSHVDIRNHIFLRRGFNNSNSSVFTRFTTNVYDRILRTMDLNAKSLASKWKISIVDVNPDLIFLDKMLNYNFTFFKSLNIPIISFQTTMDVRPHYIRMPLNQFSKVEQGWYKKLIVKLAWSFHLTKKQMSSLKCIFNDERSVSRRLLGNKLFRATFDESVSYGTLIRSVPTITLSPRTFGYPESETFHSSTQFYKPIVQLSAKDGAILHPFKRNIYCAVGSLAYQHPDVARNIVASVASAIKDCPDLNLIVSLGRCINASFLPKAENVQYHQWVNQQLVLAHADLFVTHGGLNSIMESIVGGTPMLVIPLNENFDQPANAKRVADLKIGSYIRAVHASPIKVKHEMYTILKDQTYKDNIQLLKMNFHTERLNNKENLLSFVGSIIATRS